MDRYDAGGTALGTINARLLLPTREPLCPADATKAAEQCNQTGRRGRSLPDCRIAAVTLRCGAKVATNNTGEFAPLESDGLTLA